MPLSFTYVIIESNIFETKLTIHVKYPQMCGAENALVIFFIAISLFITISPHLNVFYKLGKGNAVYESNIFETKSHAYINHSQV